MQIKKNRMPLTLIIIALLLIVFVIAFFNKRIKGIESRQLKSTFEH